jgi:hypothetical protein
MSTIEETAARVRTAVAAALNPESDDGAATVTAAGVLSMLMDQGMIDDYMVGVVGMPWDPELTIDISVRSRRVRVFVRVQEAAALVVHGS